MRRATGGGSKLMVAWAILAAVACDDDSSTPGGFSSGGAVVGGASASGGSSTLGGLGGAALGECAHAEPLSFPVTRYSLADIDGSLDLVFGDAEPKLAGTEQFDVGYDRILTEPLVVELLTVARERIRGAVAEAEELELCEPGIVSEANPDCLQAWLRRYGDQLYRRPLTSQQVDAFLVPFRDAERAKAAENALLAMVLSPYFLLRLEVTRADLSISPHDVAARLAHLVTRRIPDAELRALAESGAIYDPEVRLDQLRRLSATPAGRAARELQWLEWLGIQHAQGSEQLHADMVQQARALVSQVYDDDGGALSAFFTTSRLPLNDRLAERYGLPLPGTERLEPVQLDSQLFAGLLSSSAFLSRYPRPSQRGIAVLTSLLCAEPPPFPDALHPLELPPPAETPRRRIEAAVAGQQVCRDCHSGFDPTGFALEAFDEQGRLTGFRTDGSLRLTPGEPSLQLAGPIDLGAVVATSDVAIQCMKQRGLEYVSQRAIPNISSVWVLEPPGEQAAPPVARPPADAQWRDCLSVHSERGEPSVDVLMERIATSNLMVTRDTTTRRVVALDTNSDPIQHAYQEALQLRDAFRPSDVLMFDLYLAALSGAGGFEPPNTGGGGAAGEAGAGGEMGFAGEPNAGGNPAAGGAEN